MKANEFVKKFGWEYAKERMEYCKGARLVGMEIDLERLIESYDLIIKDFESIEMAEYEYMVSASYSDPYWVRVKQAISDVESCL